MGLSVLDRLTWPSTAPQGYGARREGWSGVVVDGVPLPVDMDYSAEVSGVLCTFDMFNRGLMAYGLAPWRFTIWVADSWGVTFIGFRPPWEFQDPHLTEWKDDYKPIGVVDYLRIHLQSMGVGVPPDARPAWCQEPAARRWRELDAWVRGRWRLLPEGREVLLPLLAAPTKGGFICG